MNKLIIAAFVAMFSIGTTTAIASGNLTSTLPPVSAQDILNQMACADKDDGEKIKDRIDGKMVKCPAELKNSNKGPGRGFKIKGK